MSHPSRRPLQSQQLLFPAESPTPRQPHATTDTQLAALESIRRDALTLQARIYRWLVTRGAYGATNEEISEALELRLCTVTPRVTELRKKGLIATSGKRPGSSGRLANVSIAKEADA